MEQLHENVSSRPGRAGPHQDDAQPDEADSSEPPRGRSRRSTEIESEKENEEDASQARSNAHAKEAFSSSNSHREYNVVRSHYNEPYVKDWRALESKDPEEAHSEGPQKYKQHYEVQTNADPLLMDPSTSDSNETPSSIINAGRTNPTSLFQHFLPQKYLDKMQDLEHPATYIPDLTEDDVFQQSQKRWLDKKTQEGPKLGRGEEEGMDNSIQNSLQPMLPDNYGTELWTSDPEHMDDSLKLSDLVSDPAMDATNSRPGEHADKDSNEVRETASDQPVSKTKVPLLPPISSLPKLVGSPQYSSSFYDDDDNDDDSLDEENDSEVEVTEEVTPPSSPRMELGGGARLSVGYANSKASYSTMFSKESREQSTDPSSWLNSSSANQAGMRGHPVDASLSPTKEELDADLKVEECSRSISSVADSIGSDISTEGPLGQAGVNYVVAKFTKSDPKLLALYTEASQRLIEGRFVKYNRRLLKKFYLDFVHETQTPSQREAVAFFRSRKRREEISKDILKTVIPEKDAKVSVEEHRKKLSMLNTYLETLDATEAEISLEDDQLGLESDGSEVEDCEDQPSLDIASLQAVGEYLITSRAFSQYKQRLDQFLHPKLRKEHETADVQGAHYDRKENHMGASRAVEPVAKTLNDTGTRNPSENQSQGMRNQDQASYTKHRTGDIWNDSRPGDVQEFSSSSSQIQARRMPWERDSFATWVAKLVTDTMWPPANGSQRIWYLCGCGQHTYIDIQELEPGDMESEWRSISESSATARRAHSPQSSASSSGQLPATPSPVHLGPTSSINTASLTSPSQETPRTPQPYLNPASAILNGPSGITRRDPMFLLICINGKAYNTLSELRCLDIDDSYNDDLLIRRILNEYEQARKGCQWTIDLLLPKWILPPGLFRHLKSTWERLPVSVRRPSFIRESLLAQSISEWWSRWESDISPWAPLHLIDTADFVEFELVPHPAGKEAFPSHFTSGRWPPPNNKQYRYRPVPMKYAKTMNLWHMRRPGPHTEVYWYNTVPKKVDGALYRPSGTVEDVVGYGVRINERLNDVLILWWSFIFILVVGIFVYVYSRCTSDDSSAFGMGAYLVAAFTVYIQLQYAWWKRT